MKYPCKHSNKCKDYEANIRVGLYKAIIRGFEKCPWIKCQLGIHIGDEDIERIAKEVEGILFKAK